MSRMSSRYRPEAPSVGITESLDAPGLVKAVPSNAGASIFQSLESALGLAAQTANILAEGRRQDRAAKRQQEADTIKGFHSSLADMSLDGKSPEEQRAYVMQRRGFVPSPALESALSAIDNNEAVKLADLERATNEATREREANGPAVGSDAWQKAENTSIFGEGVQNANDSLSRLVDQVGMTYKGNGDPEKFVDDLLAQETSGSDFYYSEGFTKAARNTLVKAAYATLDQTRHDAKVFTVDSFASAMVGGKDVGEAKAAFSSIGMKPEEFDAAVLTAMDAAAKQGNQARVAELKGALSRPYTEKMAEVDRSLTIAAAGKTKAIEDAAKYQIDQLNYAGAPFENVKAKADELVAAGTLSPSDARERVNTARNLAHERITSTFGNAVTDGIIDEETLRAEYAKLSNDPNDPNYISQDTRNALITRAREQVKGAAAKSMVTKVLTGGTGVLTETEHGSALTQIVGPTGAGFIDGTNAITNPQGLSSAVVMAGFVPAQIRQAIVGNLASAEPSRVSAAASTINYVAESDSKAWADLVSDAGNPIERAVMLKARMEAENAGGNSINQAAITRIKTFEGQLRDNPDMATPPTAESLLKNEAITLGAVSRTVLNNSRPPWAIDSLFGFDDLNPDTDLTDFAGQADRRAQQHFRDYFAMARLSEPKDKAMEKATKYAETKIKDSYEYVPWNGTIRVQPVTTPGGARLPQQFRWSDGFEAEAQADLATVITSKGLPIQPSNVVTMRPYASGKSIGWGYILDDGSFLTDDQGNTVVWTPNLDQQAKTIEATKVREKYIADDKALLIKAQQTNSEMLRKHLAR